MQEASNWEWEATGSVFFGCIAGRNEFWINFFAIPGSLSQFLVQLPFAIFIIFKHQYFAFEMICISSLALGNKIKHDVFIKFKCKGTIFILLN